MTKEEAEQKRKDYAIEALNNGFKVYFSKGISGKKKLLFLDAEPINMSSIGFGKEFPYDESPKGDEAMLPNYYEIISDTIFIFSGPTKTLKKALICKNQTLATDAYELLTKGYSLNKVANLVDGIIK